jgi:hypothetical protein
MPKRLARTIALAVAATALLALLFSASASAAPSPWWQVLDGSRPSHLWEGSDNVQEIITEMEKFEENGELFGESVAQRMEVGGKFVGCLGSQTEFGEFQCQFAVGTPIISTAAQLEAALETAYAAEVEVSGGPVGVAPLVVTVPGRGVPTISFDKADPEKEVFRFGKATTNVLSPGGSGRLLVTVTNLGDAPVDATETPVTIADQLPEGAIATGAKAIAGVEDASGPVECEVKSSEEVLCTFEGTLPSYESIEVEVFTSLTGSPPQAGAPGTITVSGGNAPAKSGAQTIIVSPDPVPYGVERFSAVAEEEGGQVARQAGGHPFQFTTTVQLNAGAWTQDRGGNAIIEQPGLPRNLRFPLPSGQVGNATVMPQCEMEDFLNYLESEGYGSLAGNRCPDETAIGVAAVTFVAPGTIPYVREAVPVFNLPPAFGEPARFGFMPAGDPIVIDTALDPESHKIIASVRNVTQVAQFFASTLSLWGYPSDPRHDNARGWNCAAHFGTAAGPCTRPPALPETAFLRMPVNCDSPLDFGVETEPWNVPVGSLIDSASFQAEPLRGCQKVPFDPQIEAAPTSKLAENPSGLTFNLNMPNSGLLNPEATAAEGQPKKVEVTLPKGVTINPSQGDGLVGCSPAQYAAERFNSRPGEGCPEASKVGTVSVISPLLKEEATGALFIASPHNNPFNSLLGLYLIARIPQRGILVKLAGKVDPDPNTGQITTTFDDLPQLPFTTFKLHFREGGRAPLSTPPTCGTYTAEARFVPWSAQDPNNPSPNEVVTRTASFKIEHGVDGGACPSGDTPPFHPELQAGTLNNAAGRFSDFNVRLSRKDGEQEFTHFSIKLPPGITGKLAGVPYCPESAIAQARSRTGAHGGQEELDSPSCPKASQIGRTLVGAGVGSLLTYVPGKIYLAGPYNGAPLSMVAVTSGVVGPFDVGTVVIRQAFRIDPETAEVFIDSTASDPIPHIIQGIPVHARDIRAYVDRPEFTLNPTSCTRTSTASTVLGSGLDFASAADDNPVTVTSPFQAADCAALSFDPKLRLQLLGGTKRGAHPRFKATLKMRGFGEAAIKRAQVTLPHSEFLENAHIKTICTRVQFKAGAGNGTSCPAGSVYGYAKATTPILSDPLTGPVFLRSSEHQLPDLVAALHSPTGIDFDLVGRIDSVKGGGIRNTFESAPDAPVSSFTLTMQGGKKGLLVNSTDLCKGSHRAEVSFDGHNGKQKDFRPELKAKCGGKSKKKSKRAK